jgi:hypothetical protein
MILKNLVLALTLVLILGISSYQVQATSTPIYLGQTTWRMDITKDTIYDSKVGTSVTLTGGLTKLGDNYYSFQGHISDYNWNLTPRVLSGGGVLINGKLILTLNISSVTGTWDPVFDHDTGVLHVSLDTSSSNYLNGSLSGSIIRMLDEIPPYAIGYFAGTMTRTGSSIPLTLAPAGPLSLLLLN